MQQRNMSSPDAVAVARPSATVVLAREGAQAPEFFLVHRHARTSFGASHVFPGGLLDAGDCEAEALSPDFSAAAANRRLGLADGGLEYYCAALRELFEETGVLLARDADGVVTEAAVAGLELEAAREALNDGRLRWSVLLRERGLTLACDALRYFAWWITPRTLPKRFSTRFFVAVLPEGQTAAHDRRELTGSRWATAQEALAAHASGELVLPPPTRATLADLAPLRTLENLLAWANRREASGVAPILPVIASEGGRQRILLPGDADYPADAGGGEP